VKRLDHATEAVESFGHVADQGLEIADHFHHGLSQGTIMLVVEHPGQLAAVEGALSAGGHNRKFGQALFEALRASLR
jgi:hypothetical protein